MISIVATVGIEVVLKASLAENIIRGVLILDSPFSGTIGLEGD